MNDIIVLIHDGETSRLINQYITDKSDYNCICTDSEKKAFEYIEKKNVEAMIIDIDEVKEWEKFVTKTYLSSKDTVCVLITENQTFEVAKQAIKVRVKDIISKPIQKKNIDEFLTLIQTISEKRVNVKASHGGADLLSRAKAYIEENYNKNITLKAMAEELSASNWHMCKIIKAATNKTFVELVSDKRMEEAKRLLTETDLTSSEICQKIGINEVTYFSNLFKRYTGTTPGTYRKMTKLSGGKAYRII